MTVKVTLASLYANNGEKDPSVRARELVNELHEIPTTIYVVLYVLLLHLHILHSNSMITPFTKRKLKQIYIYIYGYLNNHRRY